MQRRAGAIFVVFFLVVGAGAYGVLSLSEEPSVSLPGETYGAGETVSIGDQTYTVQSVSEESAALSRRNRSARYTAEISNDTTVSPFDLSWDGQRGRWDETLAEGTTVAYQDGTYRIELNTTAEPPTARLVNVENASVNETVAVGDSVTYRENETTITAIDESGVTVAWAVPYRTLVGNDTDRVRFVQQFDVDARLASDPAVYDETVTVAGVRSVVQRADNATMPLQGYLPSADTATFREGDQLTYEGNETTITDISSERVLLAWTGERTETVDLAEGENVTLAGQSYFAHVPDPSTVQILLSESYPSYQQQLEEIEYYHERANGLRGVVILSALAAILLVALASLPVKG